MTATRVTGKRVVRTQSKSWSLPICQRCETHSSLFAQSTEQREVAQNHRSTGVVCIIAGILLLFCLIGIPLLIYGIVAISALAAQAERRADELEQKAQGHFSKRCACINDAVVYCGWNGTIHTFEFQSYSYARAFTAANRNKVLE